METRTGVSTPACRHADDDTPVPIQQQHQIRALPESHEDGVPLLVDDDLLGQDGFGAGLLRRQVVLAHNHPVGEPRAVGVEQGPKFGLSFGRDTSRDVTGIERLGGLGQS